MISPRPVDRPVFTNSIAKLKSGDRITLKAVQHIEKSLWQVSFQGKLLTVSSRVALTAGEKYNGRIFWKGNTIIFKQEQQHGIVQSRQEIGANRAEQQIYRILQRLHMPVQPESLAWIAKKAGSLKDDAKITRLIAQLYDKGLEFDPRETEIDPLYVFREGGQREKDRNRKGGQDEGEGHNKEKTGETFDAVKKRFKTVLKDSVKRKGKSRLQLFNNIISGHDHWVVIPVGFKADEVYIQGSVRCKIDTVAKRVRALSVFLESGGRQFGFSVPNYGTDNPDMELFQDAENSSEADSRILRIFSEKLSKLGIDLDDTINDSGNFDGFEKNQNTGFKTVDTVI